MCVECEEECKVISIQGSGQTMKALIKVKSRDEPILPAKFLEK